MMLERFIASLPWASATSPTCFCTSAGRPPALPKPVGFIAAMPPAIASSRRDRSLSRLTNVLPSRLAITFARSSATFANSSSSFCWASIASASASSAAGSSSSAAPGSSPPPPCLGGATPATTLGRPSRGGGGLPPPPAPPFSFGSFGCWLDSTSTTLGAIPSGGLPGLPPSPPPLSFLSLPTFGACWAGSEGSPGLPLPCLGTLST